MTSESGSSSDSIHLGDHHVAHPTLLGIVVFVTGAATMIVEIAGSRFLLPYIGSSIFSWTSLIGVILASLSLGYFLGGRIADRGATMLRLSSIIFAAGISIAFIPLVKPALIASLFGISDIRARSLVGTFLTFSLPSVLLGMTLPYATRLTITTVQSSGGIVGRMSALSTVGSIAGTFLAGFYLIPNWDVDRILFALGAILVTVPFMLMGKIGMRHVLLRNIFGVVLLAGIISMAPRATSNIVVENTAYNRAWVVDSFDQTASRPIRSLITNPHGAQSQIYIDRGAEMLPVSYERFFRLAEYLNPDDDRALMIGGGAYATPMDYVNRRPHGMIDVVEIDPGLTEIARRYFGLLDNPRINIFHEDGRLFLERAPHGSYGVVFLDAFQACTPPSQLVTAEAFRLIASSLAPRGVLIINLVTPLEGAGAALIGRLIATMRTAFPAVDVFTTGQDSLRHAYVQNVIVIGRMSSMQPDTLPSPELQKYLDHQVMMEKFVAQGPLFTDSFAPVEYLIECPVNPQLARTLADSS